MAHVAFRIIRYTIKLGRQIASQANWAEYSSLWFSASILCHGGGGELLEILFPSQNFLGLLFPRRPISNLGVSGPQPSGTICVPMNQFQHYFNLLQHGKYILGWINFDQPSMNALTSDTDIIHSSSDVLAPITIDFVKQNAPILVFSSNEGTQCCFPSDANEVYEHYIRGGTFHDIRAPKVLDRSIKLYYQFSYDPNSHITRILYWIWYNFNDFPNDPQLFTFEFGSHQGDWESIEVFLFGSRPFAYILSNHTGWLGLDPDDAIYHEGHLKVWVAEGSHAHYPSSIAEPYVLDIYGQRIESVHDKISDDTSADGQFTWDTRNQWYEMSQTGFWIDNFTGNWGNTNNAFNSSPQSPISRQFENTEGNKYKVPGYKVVVQTSDREDAGTDASVYITLYGSQGRSPELPLDDMYDNFEAGRRDVFFLLTNANYGDLTQIRIRHDNSGNQPGWHLSQIVVKDLLRRKEWIFPCNRWLATDEDDHRIERILNGI